MASRLGLRALAPLRQTMTLRAQGRKTVLRQYADASAAAATAPGAAAPQQSGFAKFWNSEVGPKTVHFWAPIMKWGVILAGAADFLRPASALSVSQNGALMVTGAIWTRWCFIIRPRNLFLASANFLLFCVGATQVGRVLVWRRSVEAGKSLEGVAEDVGREEADNLKGAVKEVEGRVKQKL